MSSALDIDVPDLASRFSMTEPEGDDAAGRRAGDHVEVVGHRPAVEEARFKFRQDRCRQDAANAAAIDRQDPKRPIPAPMTISAGYPWAVPPRYLSGI